MYNRKTALHLRFPPIIIILLLINIIMGKKKNSIDTPINNQNSKTYYDMAVAYKKEGKYVYVVNGSALIGVVNMDSEEINKFVLSSQTPKVLWIPPGHYNGFKSLEENTKILFFSTSTIEESLGDDIRESHDKWNIWEEDYR